MTKHSLWTTDELDILYDYFQEGGSSLCIDKGLTNRTVKAIECKACRLGLTHQPWSDYEDGLLRDYYPKEGAKYIHSLLPNRTIDAIWLRARKLGVINRLKWSEEEIHIIKKYYKKGGVRLVKDKGISRTYNAITTKYMRLKKVEVTDGNK